MAAPPEICYDCDQPVTKARKLNHSPPSIDVEMTPKLKSDLEKKEKSVVQELNSSVDLEREEKSPSPSSVIISDNSLCGVEVGQQWISSTDLGRKEKSPSPAASVITADNSPKELSSSAAEVVHEYNSSINLERKENSSPYSAIITTSDNFPKELSVPGVVVDDDDVLSLEDDYDDDDDDEEEDDDDDDDEDYSDSEFFNFYSHKLARVKHELWGKYYEEMHASQGYEIESFPGKCGGVSIVPLPVEGQYPEILAQWHGYCEECITHYNRCHQREPKYKYAGTIDRVTSVYECTFHLYYFTFKAYQVDDPSVVETFRAEYYVRVLRPARKEVRLCELKCVHVAVAAKEDCPLPCCHRRFWTGNADGYLASLRCKC